MYISNYELLECLATKHAPLQQQFCLGYTNLIKISMKRSGFFFKTHHLSNLSKCFITKDLSVQIYRNKRKTSALVIYISHLLLKNNAFKHFKLTSWILSLFLARGSKIKSRHLIDGGPCSLSYQSKSISNEVYHHCCSWKKTPTELNQSQAVFCEDLDVSQQVPRALYESRAPGSISIYEAPRRDFYL